MKIGEIKKAVAPFVNIENARVYGAKVDKYVWVIDNVLYPAEVPANDANVNYVEDQFDALLAADREAKLKAIYRGMHKDFKGKLDGKPAIMLAAKFGGGLCPLECLNDEQIEYYRNYWAPKKA